MKIGFYINFKEYFWKSLNKLTNNFSILKVNRLGNGYIKCYWEISPIDNWRIELSKSSFYAIRLFDRSNNRNISTCIMKEIQVSKFQSSISFPIPINKGNYYFEFGYRKKNGQWRKLAYQYLNLGYRIKKPIQSLYKENWFDSEILRNNNNDYAHLKAYQLSLNTRTGGSENITHEE